ncbi:MAG: hypothetical protein WC485_10035 [Opitutaceae bacterium]
MYSLHLIGLLAVMSLPASANDGSEIVSRITDPEIRAGVEAAISKDLIPAATQENYTGSFEITVGQSPYRGATWPGLDSWQMAGAYLLLGRTQLVLDYFEFVRASQRKDGAIPMAIFPAGAPAVTFLSGLNYPDDVFIYTPPKREGVPAWSEVPRSWIGMFQEWQPRANAISTLGSVCYVLTAAEIYDQTHSSSWLAERYASIQAAAQYLLGRKSDNGLIAGSGFYMELPPRYAWDGVTQCYTIHAFRELARLGGAIGDGASQARWTAEADILSRRFIEVFWRTDHFGEYVHPDHGLVDTHGLSDVNWAAVAFGIAGGERLNVLWAKLMKEPGFWPGNVPTLNVTKPFNYEKWELNEPLPFPLPVSQLNDVAAMGRVWYLEAMACIRMQTRDRLIDSARLVCKAAEDGYWRERYHPKADGSVTRGGAGKYCEYPSVLVRVVLGNPQVFCK